MVLIRLKPRWDALELGQQGTEGAHMVRPVGCYIPKVYSWKSKLEGELEGV